MSVHPRSRTAVTADVPSGPRPAGPDKLRAVVAALDEGLVVLDEHLCVESINARGEAILEVAAEQVLGRTIDDIARGWNVRDRGPFAVSKMRHHLTRGLPYRNDEAFVATKAGELHHVSLVMIPIGHEGQCAGAVICLRDITELKLAESRLRHSEQRFRRIFQSAPTGMLRVAGDGRIDDANEASQHVLGLAGDELAARAFTELLHPDEPERTGHVLGELLAERGQRMWQGELRFLRASGGTIWSNTSLARVEPGGDEAPFVIVVLEDITERKRLEIELRHAQKLESIGRLSAGIAHEINSPVQYIGDNLHFLESAFAELSRLARTPDSDLVDDHGDVQFLLEEVPAAIEQTLEGVERISGIVRAMQVFGSPSGSAITDVDVNAAVRTTVTVAASGVQRVADIVTDLGELPRTPCSLMDLNQVLLNLIVNAADAIGEASQHCPDRPRGRIGITTRRQADGVEIAVSDTGTGIAAEHRTRIFDPFFTTKAVGRGTGQGLSVAHAVIVDRHRGRLEFDSEVDVGTTFRIWLPASSQPTSPT